MSKSEAHYSGTNISNNTSPQFCIHCGSKLDNDAAFCVICGNKIENVIESEVTHVAETKKKSKKKISNVQGVESEQKKQEENASFVEEKDAINKSLSKDNKIKKNDKNIGEFLIKKAKNRFHITLVFLILSILISGFLGGLAYYNHITFLDLENKYDILNSRYNALKSINSDLESQKHTLTSENIRLENLIRKIAKVNIFRIYNWADNSTILDHKKITYLGIEFKTQNIPSKDSVYLKILDNNNILMSGPSSPSGYTLKFNANETNIGWGNITGGSYSKGIYTIEFWYEDVCLISKNINIK